jgi:hypothetical protein
VIVTYEQHVAWCIRHSDDYQKGNKSTDAEERGLVVSLRPRTNIARRRFSCTQSQGDSYTRVQLRSQPALKNTEASRRAVLPLVPRADLFVAVKVRHTPEHPPEGFAEGGTALDSAAASSASGLPQVVLPRTELIRAESRLSASRLIDWRQKQPPTTRGGNNFSEKFLVMDE